MDERRRKGGKNAIEEMCNMANTLFPLVLNATVKRAGMRSANLALFSCTRTSSALCRGRHAKSVEQQRE